MGLLGDIGAIGTDILNYGNEQTQLQYQKGVQQTTWNREDDAVQRRVADLKAAGLNPVLAAGSAASTSAPVQVTAPEFNSSDLSKLPDPQDVAQSFLSLTSAKKDIARTQAQIDLTTQQIRKASADASMAEHDKRIWDGLPHTLTTSGNGVTGAGISAANILGSVFDSIHLPKLRLPRVKLPKSNPVTDFFSTKNPNGWFYQPPGY